ncbi:zinc finger protein 862-like [Saccoglossus kowalevskii]
MTYQWLTYDATKKVMVCVWCKEAGKVNAFTNPGCPYMVKDDCRKHSDTKQHQAVRDARMTSAPRFRATITNLYRKEEETIQSAMKNVYYMAKKNHANSSFKDLNWLLIMQGCDTLQGLKVDAHTSYEHSDSIHDFQNSMKLVIDEQIISELDSAGYFAILIDEMSDVSMDKSMIIYLRYILAGKIVVRFFEVIGLAGCNADDIYQALVSVLECKCVHVKNMFAAGTDGASVMVGKHAGVTTMLKTNINPYMISVHCIAHRLALASAQAAHKVKRIDKFEIRMNQIFNYFHYSTKHMSKIKQIYQVGGNAMHRNFVRPCDTRWLSVRGAFEAELITLKAMFYCLQSDAESGDSTARGILNEMATFDFLAILHLMADVLYYL